MKYIILVLSVFANIASAQIISTFAGNGVNGYTGDGGNKLSAAISIVGGLVQDNSGNIYISGYLNNTIRKIQPSGIITTYGGNGTAGYSGDGGQATNAQLDNPVKMAIDAAGNIYFAEKANHVIRKISTTGIISTVAGTNSGGYSGDGGMATAAELFEPTGVCLDAIGNIYIADHSNRRIRKISASGIISTIAGTGAAGSTGDGGPASSATLYFPHGIALDSAGNLYIADAGGNKIRKISSTGIINTFAGTGAASFSGDGGPAIAATFYNPSGVLTDTFGNVYITDQLNYRIRKVTGSGIITTIAGNGTPGFSGDGGAATAAMINGSNEMMIDHSGNLLFNDNDNYRVRIISNCANSITTQPVHDTVNLGTNAKYYVVTTMPTPSYQWQENSGSGFVNLTNVLPYSGVNTDTLTIRNVIMLFNNTHYRCIISNGSPCVDTSAGPILIVQDHTGIGQISPESVAIYPNPTHNNITVELPYQKSQGILQVINEIGQTVISQSITGTHTNVALDKLSPGMYFVRIQCDDQVVYKKVLKVQ